MQFVSAVNQPNRVYLSSFDDKSQNFAVANDFAFDRFRVQLPTPILRAKKCQLLRSSIPNAQVSIPDYQLVFWYAVFPTDGAGNPVPGPNEPEYRNIRFLPSTFATTAVVNPGILNGLPVNRIIANYQDFVTLLNQAANAADSLAQNPYHVAGDITFSYDPLTRHISFVGNNTGPNAFMYAAVGYSDPNLPGFYPNITMPNGRPQPFLLDLTLNLRVGFCWSGVVNTGAPLNTNTLINSDSTFIASSWGDLVYSQNIILLSNIVPGSSVGSGGQHNILAVVPINTPPLGVGHYSAPLVNWMQRIMKEIYEIEIIMLDDNYQPYLVPENAIVNVEMGFVYDYE